MSEIEANEVRKAAACLRAGGLVAFPTETVYGLGADACSSAAVRRIFNAKGRPGTNPLIAHVADAAMARRYAATWPVAADRLAARFWPGPLTLVLPKQRVIVDEATAGRGTVGLRAPDHPLAQALIREFNGPIAAPSANRSTRVSPTTAQHVRQQLGGAVDLILDGGECRVGIESTVLDLSGNEPTLLRPGGVSLAQLQEVIGDVRYAAQVVSQHVAATSPGQHAIHYSPLTPSYRFDEDQSSEVAKWLGEHPSQKAALLLLQGSPAAATLAKPANPQHRTLLMPREPQRYAQKLYAALHAADVLGAEAIWVQMPAEAPEWLAVRDRLKRATRPLA